MEAETKGTTGMARRCAEAFFFGNWFYGSCAVALGIEAALQQRVPLNGPLFHSTLFLGATAFYNHAYRHLPRGHQQDARARWYVRHARSQQVVQRVLWVLLTLCCGLVAYRAWQVRNSVGWEHVALLVVFPCVGFLYYGTGSQGLRRIGWLKPFVLGFVWAGVVTVYPALMTSLFHGTEVPDPGISVRLFFKNMMFCALIGMLFDIKDHADDHRNALRTFIVERGLRTTLFRIALPMAAVGLATFLYYGATHGFSTMKLVLNTVPFVAMAGVIYALRKRRSILYYLVVVDGLLVVKAVCGSVAMRWF